MSEDDKRVAARVGGIPTLGQARPDLALSAAWPSRRGFRERPAAKVTKRVHVLEHDQPRTGLLCRRQQISLPHGQRLVPHRDRVVRIHAVVEDRRVACRVETGASIGDVRSEHLHALGGWMRRSAHQPDRVSACSQPFG